MPELDQQIFGSSQPMGSARISYELSGVGDQTAGIATLQFSGVAPGHYSVDIERTNGDRQQELGIDVGGDHDVIDLSAQKPLVNISGLVGVVHGGGLPTGLHISLVPHEDEIGATVPVQPDGSFHFRGMQLGTYKVVVSSNTTVAIDQMRASGGTVDGHLLETKSLMESLAATLIEGTTTVMGVAGRMDGKPASGVMIVLIPNNPRAERDLFRRDQSASDGSFIFRNVIPGEYTVLAIEDGWTLDWTDPAELNRYLAKGVIFNVAQRAKLVQIKGSLNVQAK